MTTRRDAMRLLGAATLGGTLARTAAALPTADAAALPDAAQAAAPAPGARGWQVVTSAPDAERFGTRALGAFQPAAQPPETDIDVFVDTGKRFQEVFGFGGAVTESVVEVHAQLTPAAKQAFIDACCDPVRGLGYNVLRTTIHSSDFGSESYTYVRDGDQALSSFSIARDLKARIPLLRQMLASAAGHGTQMRVFATPWSAPAWMKSNNSMLGGGTLLPAYRDTWSRYIVKFVQAYEGAGIPIWGLSVQNEPMARPELGIDDLQRRGRDPLPGRPPGTDAEGGGPGREKDHRVGPQPRPAAAARRAHPGGRQGRGRISGASAITGTKPGPAARRCTATSRPSTRHIRT